MAILFSSDQSQFGIVIIGGNSGNATFSFFKRDGTLIDAITIGLPSIAAGPGYYGFQRDLGTADIAGISFSNDDLGGFGFDNLVFDVTSGPTGGEVPEPASLVLLGTGLLGALALKRRRA